MSDTAVLVVDMMNRYQHPVADVLVPDVGKIIEPMADLARRACEFDGDPAPRSGIPGANGSDPRC